MYQCDSTKQIMNHIKKQKIFCSEQSTDIAIWAQWEQCIIKNIMLCFMIQFKIWSVLWSFFMIYDPFYDIWSVLWYMIPFNLYLTSIIASWSWWYDNGCRPCCAVQNMSISLLTLFYNFMCPTSNDTFYDIWCVLWSILWCIHNYGPNQK